MKFTASNLQINTLKDGLKLTVYIEKENRKKVLADIHNFIDKPLKVGIEIDAEEREKELEQITGQQRKKLYALFGDINEYTGQGVESIKEEMKKTFLRSESNQWNSHFSLGDCSKELAAEFIDWLIVFCFRNGVQLSEQPRDSFSSIEAYVAATVKANVCAICGKYGNVHHVDTYGMGSNRNKVDDSNKKKIALCNKHHREAHDNGWITFKKKYKVKGVIVS